MTDLTLRNIGVIKERLWRFCGGAQRLAAGSRLLAKSFPSKPLQPLPPALAPDCTLALVTLKILTTDQLEDKAARRQESRGVRYAKY